MYILSEKYLLTWLYHGYYIIYSIYSLGNMPRMQIFPYIWKVRSVIFISMFNFSDEIDFNSAFPGRAANARTSGSGILTGKLFWGTIWQGTINDSITYTHTYIYLVKKCLSIWLTISWMLHDMIFWNYAAYSNISLAICNRRIVVWSFDCDSTDLWIING